MTGQLPHPTPPATVPATPVPIPITGELDLHTFSPKDLGRLIPTYLAECQLRGIYTVRIVHGKGTGALRSAINQQLKRDKRVRSYRLGDYGEGDSGVTIAQL